MSDSVNDYGLGAPNTQEDHTDTDEVYRDPLAHGLGDRDVDDDELLDEDLPEGGDQNRLEHGLTGTGYRDDRLVDSDTTDPLTGGLGSPTEGQPPRNI